MVAGNYYKYRAPLLFFLLLLLLLLPLLPLLVFVLLPPAVLSGFSRSVVVTAGRETARRAGVYQYSYGGRCRGASGNLSEGFSEAGKMVLF